MNYNVKRNWVIGASLVLLIVFYLFRNLSEFTRFGGVIFGLLLFFFVDYFLNLNFKFIHYVYVLAILFFGIMLSPLYFLYPSYDKILHFCLPFIACFLIYYLVDKQSLNLKWKLLITFMFIISFSAIHEIGEYLIDQIWDFKLQGVWLRSGPLGLEKIDMVVSHIDDTMIDMIIGMGGALAFVITKSIGMFIKNKKKK